MRRLRVGRLRAFVFLGGRLPEGEMRVGRARLGPAYAPPRGPPVWEGGRRLGVPSEARRLRGRLVEQDVRLR